MNLVDTILIVSDRLASLDVEHAFIGGSIIPFLIDDPAVTEFRPTKDVDAIVQVLTQAEYSNLEEQLRANGFTNDKSADAPICRYIVDGCIVDIMPIYPKVIGFASKWLPAALQTSIPTELKSGKFVRIIAAPYFIATKLDAFSGRGRRDYLGSHDLEDLISVIDGRSRLAQEIFECDADARGFISREFQKLLGESAFRESVSGHVPQDADPYSKAEIVLDTIQRIVQEIQFAMRLESAGLRIERIIEAEVVPGFQPPGPGAILSVTGRLTYRIRYDVSGQLLHALASGGERNAEQIYDGVNTPFAWEIIAAKIVELETV